MIKRNTWFFLIFQKTTDWFIVLTGGVDNTNSPNFCIRPLYKNYALCIEFTNDSMVHFINLSKVILNRKTPSSPRVVLKLYIFGKEEGRGGYRDGILSISNRDIRDYFVMSLNPPSIDKFLLLGIQLLRIVYSNTYWLIHKRSSAWLTYSIWTNVVSTDVDGTLVHTDDYKTRNLA